MCKEVKRYAERDACELDEAGNYYCRHVSAMTGEGLHSKSGIAAELGWRDMQIDALLAERDALKKDAERYRWLLRQAWFQSAFERYDFDDGGIQHRFELCAAEIIDANLQGEQP